MKTLYFNCMSGASGDMLTGALLGLFPSPDKEVNELNRLDIPGVTYKYSQKTDKFGLTGFDVTVIVNGETEHEEHSTHHIHRNLNEIVDIINSLNLKADIKKDIISVYNIIADAESKAHGQTVTDIHFHELGMMDAIADIAAVCYLIDKIKPDRIACSPINVGSGTVKCAHGIVSVPAPATANILKGVPIYSANEASELCTPTGAALLKYFVNEFGDMPTITPVSNASGFGKKEFSLLSNKLDVTLGESKDNADTICEMVFSVDDMTGEEIGYACDIFRDSGAVEVYTKPIFMKKSRPGTEFTILCKPEDKEHFISLVFAHTTTIGFREKEYTRHLLKREFKTFDTSYGKIRVKISAGYGVKKKKIEYDDLKAVAKKQNLPLRIMKRHIIKEIKKGKSND